MSGFFNKIGTLTSQRDLKLEKAKEEAIRLFQDTGEHHSVMGISTANFTFRVTNSVMVLTEEEETPWHEVWSTVPKNQSLFNFKIVCLDADCNVVSTFKDGTPSTKERHRLENEGFEILNEVSLKKEYYHILEKFKDKNIKPVKVGFYPIY